MVLTWPHSHYLMRQCEGVSGWVCKCRSGCEGCRCKINDQLKDDTGNSIIFILPGPLALPTLIQLLRPLGPFLLPCSAQTSAFPRLPQCFPGIVGRLGASRRFPAALVLPRDYWLTWYFPKIASCLGSRFRRACIRLGCNLIVEY